MKKVYQSVNKSIDIESSTKHTSLIKINLSISCTVLYLFVVKKVTLNMISKYLIIKYYSLTVDHLKAFLEELKQNEQLRSLVENAPTASEIAEIANEFGFKFSGDELKAISKENLPGIKVTKQDTSPSYSFGESGN